MVSGAPEIYDWLPWVETEYLEVLVQILKVRLPPRELCAHVYELRPRNNGTAELRRIPLRKEVKAVVEPLMGVDIRKSKQYNLIYFSGQQETLH